MDASTLHKLNQPPKYRNRQCLGSWRMLRRDERQRLGLRIGFLVATKTLEGVHETVEFHTAVRTIGMIHWQVNRIEMNPGQETLTSICCGLAFAVLAR